MNTFKQYLVNTYYRCKQKLGGISFPDSIQVISPKETLDKIIYYIEQKKIGAYLRFGDGEINMIEGKGAIEQEPNTDLAKEMQEALDLHGETILKSLMIHSKKFGMSKGMTQGMHLTDDAWAQQLLMRCFPYFIGSPIYSHAAFAYTAVFQPEIFLKTMSILRSHEILFVGNESISENLIKDIFGPRTHIIKTISKNTFNNIEQLDSNIKDVAAAHNASYKVIIYAAGPTSNVLQKRSIVRGDNVFSVDIGSLIDAFAGNVSRAWIDQVPGGKTYWTDLISKIKVL